MSDHLYKETIAKGIELNVGKGIKKSVNLHLSEEGHLVIEGLGTASVKHKLHLHNENIVELEITSKITPIDKQTELLKMGVTKPWLVGKTPNGFWNYEDNQKMALKWLFEEKLQWTEEDIKKKTTKKVFTDNKLMGMLKNAFGSSPYRAVEFYSDGKIKPWEMKVTPMSYFDALENQIAAVKWLFDEKLKWTDEDFKNKMSKQVFIDNGLASLFSRYNNYYQILELVYPKRFNAWEVMDYVPHGFWDKKENRLSALQWLFEDNLKWTEKDIITKINIHVFREYGLDGLFQLKYESRTYEVVEELYPGKYKPWELPITYRGFWDNEDECIDAMKWLINEKCPNKKLTFDDFKRNGLLTLLIKRFNGSVKNAVKSIQ